MRLLLGLAARNALRNVTRSLLTALTVVLGTALLTLALTWQTGVFGSFIKMAAASTGHVRLVDPDYAQREELFPLYENIPDVDAVVERVLAVPGVEAAYPRITAGVTLTAGEEIGDVFGMAVGAPRAYYTESLDLDAVLMRGRMPEAADEWLIGATLANKTGVPIDGELVLLGQTQDGAMSPMKGTVVGVVQGGNALIDQQVYLPLEQMQYMTDIPGGATEILVYGSDRDEAAALRDALGPAAEGLLAQAWSDRDPWRSIIAMGSVIRTILSGIVVFITALGVWNTMMMSVLERTGEIGVLRAMGLSRLGAVFLFVVEAMAIAVLGGGLGVALGSIGGYLLETRGIRLGDAIAQNADLPFSTTMYGDLTVGVVVTSFFLGLLMAVVGSAPPALRAASIQPVAAMRARR